MSDGFSWSRYAGPLVAGLTVLALGLRLASLGQSPFGDELYLFAIVDDHSLGDVLSLVHDTEKTPPLGFVLGWLFARGDDADLLVRLPSLAAGVATVPLVYAIGVRTVGRAAALFAAAWFALSPFQIFYATESRSYALVTALVALSTLSLLIAVERRRPLWWALYALAAAGAVYTHYIAVLVLIPQGVWALWAHRETLREQLLANAAVVVAFLPWLPSFLVQLRNSEFEAAVIDAVAPLTASQLAEISGRALAGHPFLSLRDLFGLLPLIAIAVTIVVAAVALVLDRPAGRRRRVPALSANLGLLGLLTVAPLAGIALYSLQPDTSFLLPRNISVGVPYALLLFGWLLTRPPPFLALALSAVALVALAVGAVSMLDPDRQRPDARDAARFIDANAPPGAPVIELGFGGFQTPPGAAIRIQLRRPHAIYEGAERQAAWRAAARAGSPLFVSYFDTSDAPEAGADVPPLDPGLLEPPPRYRSRYELIAKNVSRGLIPVVVREYAPR